MSTGTRIYVVSSKSNIAGDQGHRMVRAANPSQALRHVAAGLFDVDVATQDQLVDLASKGIKVENAGADPQTQQQPE